jgi:1-acyl-sn-glycerol-3-phosphate acyltransferase
MIASIVLLVTWLVLGLPAAVIFYSWTLVTGDILPLYNVALWITRAGTKLAGVRVEVEGLELVPAGTACIFMANHVSNLDPPVLLPLIPGRTSIFLKRSLMKIPVLGYGMKLADLIPVERTGHIDSAKESIAAARRVLAKGVHMTTFVEGTRSNDGRLLPFKKGPFFLAKQTGAPCIPVSIYGTGQMMPRGRLRIRRGTAHVVFHAPVNPGDFRTREELLKAVRAAIASGLPERMQTAGNRE